LTVHTKFVSDTFITVVASGLQRLRGIVLIPLFTKVLGGEVFGIWNQISVTVALFASVTEMNLHSALVRFGSGVDDKKELAQIYYKLFFLASGFSLVIVFLLISHADVVSMYVLGDVDYRQLFKVGLFLVIFQVMLSLELNYFRTIQRIAFFSTAGPITSLLELGTLALGIWSGLSLLQLLILLLLVDGGIVMILFVWIAREIGIVWPSWTRIGESLKFALPGVPLMASVWVFTYSDRYFLGHYFGPLVVGSYALAYTISDALMFFQGPVSRVLFPTASKLYNEGQGHEAWRLIHYSNKYFLSLAIPGLIAMSLFQKELYHLFWNTSSPVPSLMLIPAIGAGIILYGAFLVYSQAFYLLKKTHHLAMLWGAAAVANVLMNIPVVPRFGAVGAAITSLVSYALLFLGSYVIIRRSVIRTGQSKILLKLILATGILLVPFLIPGGVSVSLVLGAFVTCCFAFFFLLWRFSFFSNKEFLFLRQLVQAAFARKV